LRNWNLSMI